MKNPGEFGRGPVFFKKIKSKKNPGGLPLRVVLRKVTINQLNSSLYCSLLKTAVIKRECVFAILPFTFCKIRKFLYGVSFFY